MMPILERNVIYMLSLTSCMLTIFASLLTHAALKKGHSMGIANGNKTLAQYLEANKAEIEKNIINKDTLKLEIDPILYHNGIWKERNEKFEGTYIIYTKNNEVVIYCPKQNYLQIFSYDEYTTSIGSNSRNIFDILNTGYTTLNELILWMLDSFYKKEYKKNSDTSGKSATEDIKDKEKLEQYANPISAGKLFYSDGSAQLVFGNTYSIDYPSKKEMYKLVLIKKQA